MVGDKEVRKQLKKLDERVRKKVLKSAARKALKPVVQLYKNQIEDSDEVFAVYRDGKVYAEIAPSQLRESIGVKFPKQEKMSDNIVASVGPRKKGSFANPEKGGWYAGFISFGWLRFKDGTRYRGDNYKWSERAIRIGERFATPRIKTAFSQFLKKEIKKLGFGQKIGLR